jgi:hypothetical protein
MINNMQKLLFLVTLCLCFGIPQILYAETETIRFDNNNVIKIDVQSQWRVVQRSGTPIPGMEGTHDLEIIPTSNEKALLQVTIARQQNGTPLTKQQFEALANGRVKTLLPDAVERTAKWQDLQLNDGYAKYCILTDKSLVKKRPKPDEYIYLALYFANYDNGYIIYATALTDDFHSASFKIMLNTLSSIEPIYNETSF